MKSANRYEIKNLAEVIQQTVSRTTYLHSCCLGDPGRVGFAR